MADKKSALITGANKGIGKEIARQLGAMGYVVLLGARDEQRGTAAADELKAQGVDARAVKIDCYRSSKHPVGGTARGE